MESVHCSFIIFPPYKHNWHDRKMTYNSVWPIDLLQLFSNVPCSIWASIIYDYNFIVEATKIKKKIKFVLLGDSSLKWKNNLKVTNSSLVSVEIYFHVNYQGKLQLSIEINVKYSVCHFQTMYVKVKVTQSCPSLCDPVNYRVHGISRPEY